MPECYRVHDALAETGGVRAKHSTTLAGFTVFSKTFSSRVGEMPDLPPAVAEALKAGAQEPELVRALVEAGTSRKDRGEPSWAVLGRLAQEARFVQVHGRLVFLKFAT